MHILRQDISIGFWNKPSYLMSLVINELAKPAGERMEWLMYVLYLALTIFETHALTIVGGWMQTP